MRQLACVLGLIALAALVPLLMQLNGATATIFSFVGYPCLGLALVAYGIARWRAGAFRFRGQ